MLSRISSSRRIRMASYHTSVATREHGAPSIMRYVCTRIRADAFHRASAHGVACSRARGGILRTARLSFNGQSRRAIASIARITTTLTRCALNVSRRVNARALISWNITLAQRASAYDSVITRVGATSPRVARAPFLRAHTALLLPSPRRSAAARSCSRAFFLFRRDVKK